VKASEVLRRPLPQAILTRAWRGAAICVSLSLATFAVGSACQIVGGYQSFQPHPCNVLPASKIDESGLNVLVLSKQTDGQCYWIDKTEVTVQRYSQFLEKVTQPIRWQPDVLTPDAESAQCAWKTSPSNPAQTSDSCTDSTKPESTPFGAEKPIRCVDWCDARAFCVWAGKDLCGGDVNGSFVLPADVPDQWGFACSPGGSEYLSGSVPVDGQCNVGLSEAECLVLDTQSQCAPADVGSFPKCSASCGAVDMIGNVAEWVLSCDATGDGGPGTLCQHRGRSFADDLAAGTCYDMPPATDTSDTRDRTIGLRCCAALTADESNLTQQ
jgi:formylglycine-generating enzyme required for sulfatase activity